MTVEELSGLDRPESDARRQRSAFDTPLLKQWFEAAERIRDGNRDPIQRIYEGPPFGEPYARGDLSLHLHVSFQPPHDCRRSHQYCAEFQRFTGMGGREIVKKAEKCYESASETEAVIGGHRHGGNQQSMFVVVGEVSQQREWVNIGSTPRGFGDSLPSVVRLKSLDLCALAGIDFPKVSLSLRPELFAGVGDRKGNVTFTLDTPAGVEQRKLVGEVVEYGAKIVHRVSKHHGNATQELCQIGHFAYVQDIAVRFRLELGPDMWAIGFDGEGVGDVGLDGIAVLFGTT